MNIIPIYFLKEKILEVNSGMQGIDYINLVQLIYQLKLKEMQEHRREKNVYWVTDLVRCPLKRYYEITYPELITSQVFTPPFIQGDLIHKGLERLLKEAFPEGKVSVEVEGGKEVVLPDGKKVTVEGRADAIISSDDEKIGVEIKSLRSDVGIPLDHHVDQVRAYNWLFNLSYSILIYVTPERITQYMVSDKFSEGEVIERILSNKAPRYPWECTYCPYSVLCPNKVTSK